MNLNTDAIQSNADVMEFREVLSNSETRLKKTLRPSLIATTLFVVFVFATFLFTDKGPLHRYWQPLGVIFDFLSMATLLAVVYTVGTTYNAWSLQRSNRREFKEFLEDRYGASER